MSGLLLLFLIYSPFLSKSSRKHTKALQSHKEQGLDDIGSSEGEGGELGGAYDGLNRVQTLEIRVSSDSGDSPSPEYGLAESPT